MGYNINESIAGETNCFTNAEKTTKKICCKYLEFIIANESYTELKNVEIRKCNYYIHSTSIFELHEFKNSVTIRSNNSQNMTTTTLDEMQNSVLYDDKHINALSCIIYTCSCTICC